MESLSLEWRVPFVEQETAMLVAINPPPELIVLAYREPDDRAWCYEIFDVRERGLLSFQMRYQTGLSACLSCEFDLAGMNELSHVEPGQGKIVWR